MHGVELSPVEIIERLIAFDTTSRRSNLELIDFIAEYLRGHGVEPARIFDAEGRKANLFASIGPDRPGGVVLSGHTDVVPVDGQAWSSDPFRMERQDGRLYGRGTADMKSFCVVALAMVPQFLKAPLDRPVHLAFSYDEEVGCLGVHGIVEHLRGRPQPALAIVGEPTLMQVTDAHKSCTAVNTTVLGLEQHSSAAHAGVNAVMYAAEIIHFLNGLAEELRLREVPDAGRFDPPFSTLQVGVVAGGTARNIIARTCEFQWEYRTLPGTDETEVLRRVAAFAEEDLLPRMRHVFPGAVIRNEVVARAPALRPQPGSPAETLAKALVGSNATQAVSYGTEAGIFQDAGLPTAVCGPGSIAVAHQPDEYIEVGQVEACVAFMHRLIGRLSAA